MGTNLMAAARQWANRPADERYWNLDDLEQYLIPIRSTSKTKGELTEDKKPTFWMKDLRISEDGDDLKLVGPQGGMVNFTNWSFGQFCHHLEAPPEYISNLPTKLAMQCLEHGLSIHGDIPIKVLLQQGEQGSYVSAITSPKYSRIWDLDIVRNLQPAIEAGWCVPPARPSVDDPRSRPATDEDCFDQGKFWGSVKPGDMIAPAGVYRGDRDSFIFMVNPNRTIDDGGGNGGLMRGIFMSNSEVGYRAFKITTFLLENVCSNHICWGANVLVEKKIVHKGRAKDIFTQEIWDSLRDYNESETFAEENMIKLAKSFELASDREKLVERLFGMKKIGLATKHIEAAFTMAEKFEWSAKCPPTMAWGFVHGLTRYSQTLPNADQRHLLDVAGGKLLSLVTAG
jgi:hypothetical protein